MGSTGRKAEAAPAELPHITDAEFCGLVCWHDVRSNVRGWKVTDESLQQLKYRSSTGATAALAKSLLSQAASSKSAIKGSAKANKKR